ncbi:hypothetical protein [Lentzea aerocolonigenes]|uniref:hypothetical protein n=1 Tax=Lentzea aerocolonigenes TaxID=68170 RepID=UPI00138E43D1|nr:hypothetical protein [Lentzea aerocolonigenes]
MNTDCVSGLLSDHPGNRFCPRKYWVPSVVVTFQYSPSSSPLAAPLKRSMRAPSSFFARQTLTFWSSCALTSWPDTPTRLIVALSVAQHWSPVFVWPLLPPRSRPHGLYCRSMNPPGVTSQPSPTIDAWLFVDDVRPSRLCEE